MPKYKKLSRKQKIFIEKELKRGSSNSEIQVSFTVEFNFIVTNDQILSVKCNRGLLTNGP